MSKIVYKTVDLFGNETILFSERKRESQKSLFHDYEGFKDKFKKKLTTDDCYTPEPVYNAILEHLNKKFDLSDKEILRPFQPGGDYQSVPYKDNSVVIDNPPFSILAKIAQHYVKNEIKFFLFAPHLTCFNSIRMDGVTAVVVGASVVYHNKARVNTSFLTNMYGDYKVVSDLELFKKLTNIQRKEAPLPKYVYPKNVLTASEVFKLMRKGIEIKVPTNEALFVRDLDHQKKHKKGIFGGGLLISNKQAEKHEKDAHREYLKLQKEGNKDAIKWELSERERKIINNLK